MSTVLWIILSLVLAEIGYTFTYLITYFIARIIFDVMALVIRKRVLPKVQPWIYGLFAGCCGCFSALFILFTIRGQAGITANWYFILGIFIIFYGQVQYFGQNLRAVPNGIYTPIGWPGRFNAAASAPIQRGQFEYYKEILRQQNPDQIGLEGDPIGNQSYLWVKQYMLKVSLATLAGIIVGIPLYYTLIYK
ncbi:MAG TPA: hypothetical protein VIM07_07095 [Chitinophagaceae bacterium]